MSKHSRNKRGSSRFARKIGGRGALPTASHLSMPMESLEPRLLLSGLPVDLMAVGSVAQVNGAIFKHIESGSTGTGNIDSFVRVQHTGSEQGYNTDSRASDPVQTDVNTSPTFTRSLRLSDIPRVVVGGLIYRELLLDVNESSELVSLDRLKVFTASSGSLSGFITDSSSPDYEFGTRATKIWDLDNGSDRWIKLDLSTDSGSGQGNVVFYVAETAFGATAENPNPYIYLYSQFGAQGVIASGDDAGDWGTDDGFEEWAVGQSAIPVVTPGQILGYKYDYTTNDRLAGWTFVLTGANGSTTVVTDSNGQFVFENVVAGLGDLSTYTVTEQAKPGWTQKTANPPSFVVAAVQDGSNILGQVYIAYSGQGGYTSSMAQVVVQPLLAFGNESSMATISGVKFNDLDGDGQKDAGDSGLADWWIYLDKDGSGTLNAGDVATQTDSSGNYSFSVQPGAYQVREVQQDGWIQTTATTVYVVNVAAGNSYSGRDFGNFKLFSISGRKVSDADGNATTTTDRTGLSGWTIQLMGSATATAVTDASGNYSFTNLGPGSYTLSEMLKEGWTQVFAPTGAITAVSGTNVTGKDFGNFQNITISGTKYIDIDGDPQTAAGNTPAAGWTITLGGAASATAVTDANGNYSFANLGPGSYTLTETLKSGWTQVFGPSQPIAAQSGQNVTAQNFGNFKPGSITGQKFIDWAHNAVRDPGDDLAGGFTIELYRDSNGNGQLDLEDDPDALVSSAVTDDATGAYLFDSLTGGKYFVRESAPGWLQTLPVELGYYTVDVVSGTQAVGKDFGNFRLNPPVEGSLSICGMKFADTANFGYWDQGEYGIPDWGIQLFMDKNGDDTPQANEVIATVTTDSQGHYLFEQLECGHVYMVREVQQTGWVQTTANPSPMDGPELNNSVFMPVDGFVTLQGTQVQVIEEGLAFGNAHMGGANAHTLGFWSNKNGQKLITAEDLALLNTMNLRNPDGTDFTFDLSLPLATNKTRLNNWLLSGNAKNMANMLSIQLAAMVLNVQHDFVDSSEAVITFVNGAPTIMLISSLINNARTVLYTPLYDGVHHTPLVILGGHGDRPAMDILKSIIDDANNNQNFLW
jgi:protocatechuate 3,4-dioxygenase beta subunit